MVREQYAIDPAWFLTPTLFPLDARDINITNNDGVREEYNAFFINEHWYRAVGGKWMKNRRMYHWRLTE